MSIEKSIRERSRIQVGDVMRFDVLGRIVEARVTSVREVEWDDAQERRLHVRVPARAARARAAHLHRHPARRRRIRRPAPGSSATSWRSYPNVSAIDVREVLASIQGVVDNVTFAISIVGAVALASGVLILIGAVAMTKFQRVYEAAILRTLGASTRLLGTMLALEYSALGLLAGVVGAAGALGLELGGLPLRLRDRLGAGAGAAGGRRPRHDRARRHHRRRRQRRRPAEEAAGDAAGGVRRA